MHLDMSVVFLRHLCDKEDFVFRLTTLKAQDVTNNILSSWELLLI